jgi:hypothetical protein
MANKEDEYKRLRAYLNKAIRGPNTDAILKSLAHGPVHLIKNVEAVNDSLYIVTAKQKYLDQRLGDKGVSRPADVGLSDDVFRDIGIEVTNRSQVRDLIHQLLKTLYGEVFTRATSDSSEIEKYYLEDGDNLIVSFDQTDPVEIVFSAEQFENINNATAQEVADAITKSIRKLGRTGAAFAQESGISIPSPGDFAQNLVSWYRLGDDVGDNIANLGTCVDQQGLNDGNCFGTSIQKVTNSVPGTLDFENQYSTQFDGNTDYVDIVNSPSLSFERTDAFSFSFWFNTTSNSAEGVIGNLTDSPEFKGYAAYIHGTGGIYFYLGDDITTSKLRVHTNNDFNDGNWHHAVISYDGSSSDSGVRIFVDGNEEVVTSTGDATLTGSTVNSENTKIGRYGAPTNSFFDGLLDEVAIYNKALTLTEAQLIYNDAQGIDLTEDKSLGNEKVVLISSTDGPASSVKVLGGKAQNVLKFNQIRPTTGDFSTQWTLTQEAGGNIRATWSGGADPSIGKVKVGDYVNIYGTALDIVNRGTFTITTAQGGLVNEAYVEFENPNGIPEGGCSINPSINVTPALCSAAGGVWNTPIAQGTEDAILFFNPRTTTLLSKRMYAASFQTTSRTLEIYMPATTKVVRRDRSGAAHIYKEGYSNENQEGPYLFDPTQGFVISETSASTTEEIDLNSDSILFSDDVSGFPDDAGKLILGFGTSHQEGPIPYISRPSSNTLRINPSYTFKKKHYLTDSVAGRLYAEDLMEEFTATGIIVLIYILYPNDIGLGNWGDEEDSEKYYVWGTEDELIDEIG